MTKAEWRARIIGIVDQVLSMTAPDATPDIAMEWTATVISYPDVTIMRLLGGKGRTLTIKVNGGAIQCTAESEAEARHMAGPE